MKNELLVVMYCVQHKRQVVVAKRRPAFKGQIMAAEGWCHACQAWHEMDLFNEDTEEREE